MQTILKTPQKGRLKSVPALKEIKMYKPNGRRRIT